MVQFIFTELVVYLVEAQNIISICYNYSVGVMQPDNNHSYVEYIVKSTVTGLNPPPTIENVEKLY